MFRSIEFTGSGEQLGDGFDSSTGTIKPSALKGRIESNGEMPEYLKESFKQTHLQPTLKQPLVDSYSLEFVQSKTNLYDYLTNSDDLIGQAKGNIKGVTLYANGSRKSNFFSKVEMNKVHTYILFEYHIRYRAYTLPLPSLSQRAKELWQKSGADRFRKRYGDEFIIGFAHSAEYSALIEISDQSWKGSGMSKLDLRGAIGASLGVPLSEQFDHKGNLTSNSIFGATVKVDKGEAQEKSRLSDLYQSTVRCYKRGAHTQPQIILSLAELIGDFQAFKVDVREHGGIEYMALLADYDYLDEIDESIVPESLQRLKRQVDRLTQRKQLLEQKLFQLECRNKFSALADCSVMEESRGTLDVIDSFMTRYLTTPSLVDPLEIQKLLERCQGQSRKVLAALD